MARIPESEIERLKAEVSLVRLIEAAGHTLTKQGKDWALRCPLHEGDATPSLMVTPEKNVWHCFGCQRGGSVIDWVMATRHVSFRHAVELLQHGSPVLVGSPVVAARTAALAFTPSADDQALLGQVIEHYHATLQDVPEARAYLASRGLDHPEVVAQFRLGYANRTLGYRLPEKNRVAGAALRGALQRIGILRESGHEHFAGSLVIPVFAPDGQVTEVYGRKVRDDLRVGTPKHLYLPGPHRGVFNAAGIAGCEAVIVCEALLDALTFWCAGYRNVTSAFGVSGFTDELLQALITNGTRRVWIAYDADEAGDTAAQKLAEVLAAQGIAAYRVRFPKGMDANAYAAHGCVSATRGQESEAAALKVGPATKSLGVVLDNAAAMMEESVPKPRAAVASFLAAASASPEITPSPLTAPDPPPSEIPALPPLYDAAALSAPLPPLLAHEPVLAITENTALMVRGERRYRVRGWEKNLSAEVLRVNVQVSNAQGLHVDTLDLYQARARGALIKAASGELGVAETLIAGDVMALLRALEPLQEQAIRGAVAPAGPTLPALSAAEEAAALAWLRDRNLVDNVVADVAATGLVGEPTNVLVGYLAAVSRLLPQPLAILIQSTSAAGKSALMEAVLNLMPESERVQYSAMTGQSLFYLGEKDLQHKILAIAEEEGVRQAAYALKLLQSQGELTIASTGKDPQTGKLVTAEYRVQGPVMLFLTTTAIEIDEELLNRCLVLTIDESREQTRAIQQRQRTARTLAGLLQSSEAAAITTRHRHAQTLLRPLAVVNPYAEQLGFLDERTRTRRDHQKYLTLIDAIALLHQHQRPIKTVEHRGQVKEYIEATPADIALANRLAHEVLGRSLDELPPQTRRVLGAVREWVQQRMGEVAGTQADVRFTRRELREHAGLSDTQARLHLERLVQLEYVLAHQGRNGQRFVYELLFDGALDAGGPRLAGLIEIGSNGAVAMTSTVPVGSDAVGCAEGMTATSRGNIQDLAGRLRAACGPLAAPSPSKESALSVSTGAALASLAAGAPETPRLGRASLPPGRHRNDNAVAGEA